MPIKLSHGTIHLSSKWFLKYNNKFTVLLPALGDNRSFGPDLQKSIGPNGDSAGPYRAGVHI